MIYGVLFYEFFKIGLFAIGGGLATLPFLYNLSDKYPAWFDSIMLTNMIAISESTPGPIGVNMATYAGYQTAGLLGGCAATVGLIFPSVIIIIIISKLLQKFRDNPLVERGFKGLRPAVTGLIAAAGFEVVKVSLLTIDRFEATGKLQDLLNIKGLLLGAILLFLTRRFKGHPIIYIIGAAIAGIILNID